ncbi:hypothetical protein [Vandammella animalimorsus]|uniref:hypothetical protein n=1 Tax=Vandammella animalimorsus TaxID=2029117 RepID=UPI001EEE5D86|nr:hypothetical protein [Vandammella animalimorsus]
MNASAKPLKPISRPRTPNMTKDMKMEKKNGAASARPAPHSWYLCLKFGILWVGGDLILEYVRLNDWWTGLCAED